MRIKRYIVYRSFGDDAPGMAVTAPGQVGMMKLDSATGT